jgi:anti-sigma regulatory factor (Ser/Thr protein kinase)
MDHTSDTAQSLPCPGAVICEDLEALHMADTAADWSHQATFEASPISASYARSFVTQHLVDHRLLYLVDPVRLVVSELATNALVHARTAFVVTLAATGQTVLLAVRDQSLPPPARQDAKAMDLSGRGLAIVDVVSLDWGVRQDRTASKEVWASFAIRPSREF